MLSSVLSGLSQAPHSLQSQAQELAYTIVAPAYRGYWTSTGKPSQRGIEEDGRAIFKFLEEGGYKHLGTSQNPRINLSHGGKVPERVGNTVDLEEEVELILWGQSIGANIAMTTLANHLTQCGPEPGLQPPQQPLTVKLPPPAAIILETPFLSIPEMLVELYPQRWLPYRYLSPFLRNWWDMQDAANKLHIAGYSPGKISILVAENDELVGRAQGEKIYAILRNHFAEDEGAGQRELRKVVVKGALHVECLLKGQGRREVMGIIQAVGEGPGRLRV